MKKIIARRRAITILYNLFDATNPNKWIARQLILSRKNTMKLVVI